MHGTVVSSKESKTQEDIKVFTSYHASLKGAGVAFPQELLRRALNHLKFTQEVKNTNKFSQNMNDYRSLFSVIRP